MSQVSNIGNGWKWPKFFPPPISKFSSIHNQSSPAESLKTTTTWDDVRLIDMTHDKRKLFPAYSFTMDSLRGVSHPGLETLIRSMWYRWYVRTCRRFFQNQQIPPESIPTSGLTLRFQYVFTLAFWWIFSSGSQKSWEIRQWLPWNEGFGSIIRSRYGRDFHPYATVALAPLPSCQYHLSTICWKLSLETIWMNGFM